MQEVWIICIVIKDNVDHLIGDAGVAICMDETILSSGYNRLCFLALLMCLTMTS